MWEWLEVYENLSGHFLSELSYDHSPVYIGIFANVPATWQTSGRIYFIDSTGPDDLLLGTENVFFNLAHRAEFTFNNNYKILIKPPKYLGTYALKIGADTTSP